MTMSEKVLARASGRSWVKPGDVVVARVDRAVLLDTQFSSNIYGGRLPAKVPYPEHVTIVLDHAVPAPSVRDANAHAAARSWAKDFKIQSFFDLGRHGICHQVIAENALARPGELLVCSDSHTCAAGAFNCAGQGVGGAEMLQVVSTGGTWFTVQPTIQVELTGMVPDYCDGKDIFLGLGKAFGSAGGQNLEFSGDGITTLSLHNRRIIATQCVELNAEFVLFPADVTTSSYLRERGVQDFSPVVADRDAEFAGTWLLNLSDLEPLVALPGGVIGNVVPAMALDHIRLNQCFIGSCANGHIEDLRLAARILKGRSVASGTRLIVTPASHHVYLEAVKAGYVETIIEAGGLVTNSTCGACFGYHMGVLGDGEVCLTASTRNFKGRMGSPNAEVFMASPATVAASAITGCITDPRELTGE